MPQTCPLYLPLAVLANREEHSIQHAIALHLLGEGHDFTEVLAMMGYTLEAHPGPGFEALEAYAGFPQSA